MLENIFKSILITSISGTVLGCILLLTGGFSRKHFGCSWSYRMWICVMLVMLLPFSLKLTPKEENRASTSADYTVQEVTQHTFTQDIQIQSPQDESENTENPIIRKINTESEKAKSFFPTLSVIWLSLAIVIFASKVVKYALFCRHITAYCDETTAFPTAEYMGKGIPVRICKAVASPCLVGVISPVLLLPDTALSKEQTDCILSHEAVHFKRRDNLAKWLCAFVKSVHFFNPFVYISARALDRECEISCDAAATKRMDKAQKVQYASTILALLEKSLSKPQPLTTGMTSEAAILKKRFAYIKNTPSPSVATKYFSVLLAAVFVFFTLFQNGVIIGKTVDFSPSGTKESITTEDSEKDTDDTFVGYIQSPDSPYIDIYDSKTESLFMSIPKSVTDGFLAADEISGLTNYDIFCGKQGDFFWAAVCTRPVMSSCTVAICTSVDGGKSWYHDSGSNISMGIVENVSFTSRDDGVITYSGGGHGKGVSITHDGGKTWEHSMEYGYSLPISGETALTLLKHQLTIAYENTYGDFTPLYKKPQGAVPDSEYLRYAIENLEITKEDEDYFYIPVIWDFLVEKSTGKIVKFYDGLDKMLIPFDPYSPTALSFAG